MGGDVWYGLHYEELYMMGTIGVRKSSLQASHSSSEPRSVNPGVDLPAGRPE
jgi:hypothetical protein